MKKLLHHKNIKLNNSGAAIVTVIVVCAFISVIATTLLYVSARNFQTKQVDYQNKTSFYQAEECLDTLKGLLVEEVNDAFEHAYNDTMANYVDFMGTPSVDYFYAQSFTERLSYRLEDYYATKAGGIYSTDSEKATAAIKYFMTSSLNVASMVEPEKTKYIEMIDCIQSVERFYIPPSKEKFVIKGITVRYTSPNNYSTYIKTDIGLELPDLDLPVGVVWGSTAATDYKTIDIAGCVKYMNWKRD